MGILIIESTFRSGTSVTARFATLQNRKVFALPHEVWSKHGMGTNRLIKNGAILVTCIEDILQEFKNLKNLIKTYNTIQKIDLKSIHFDYDIFENSEKTFNPTNSTSNSIHSLHSNNLLKKKILADSQLSYLYDLITTEPITINQLSKKTSKSISKISNDLFLLELEGYIKKVAGGYICILDN